MNDDLVFVDEFVSGIRWDAKYATWDNLVGKPVDGYLVTAPHGYKPGASGTTLVYRPTPCVRFMHRNEASSQQFLSRMARFITRKHFSPRPFAPEPAETLLSCLRAKEHRKNSTFVPPGQWRWA